MTRIRPGMIVLGLLVMIVLSCVQRVTSPTVKPVSKALVLRGDLNCDGAVNFKDIGPFTVYLSDFKTWYTSHFGCSPANGDINADGTYPSLKDINPFVVLLSLPTGEPGHLAVTPEDDACFEMIQGDIGSLRQVPCPPVLTGPQP